MERKLSQMDLRWADFEAVQAVKSLRKFHCEEIKLNALLQRLKELDPAKFEELCYTIWSEKLPGAGIHHAEGRAGDKGADLFAGTLNMRPAIWQCKFFKDGIRDVQTKQIRKSLKSAISNFDPGLWTLCVPVNLDIRAHSWFQKLVQEHSSRRKIELFGASAIVKELIFRKPIRTAFFPGATLEDGIEEIKAVLRGERNFTDDQLRKHADETVDQYIERLRTREPRYDYRLSYHAGSSGLAATEGDAQAFPPGTILSAWRGNTRLDLLARDIEALRKDPPSLSVGLSAEGAKKLQLAFQSGSQVRLGPGELTNFRSSFDFLMTAEEIEQLHELVLTPRFPKVRKSLRVSFVNRTGQIVYDLIEFDITAKQLGVQGGRRVLELISTSKHIPFQIDLSLDLEGGNSSNFVVTTRFAGHDILEVQKFFRAMKVIRPAGDLELYDLKQSKALGVIHLALDPISEERKAFEGLTDKLAEISTAFGQRLIAPEVIDNEDLRTLAFLLEVSRQGEIAGGTVTNLTAKLVKGAHPAEAIFGPLSGEFTIGLENQDYPVQHFLGRPISIGPYRIIIERATLIDLEEVKSRYQTLPVGQAVPIGFESIGSVRQVFLRFYRGEPLTPLVQF